MEATKEKWVAIDSGGRVMLKAVGEPQIICTLETTPLKITREVKSRACLIAAAPDLLDSCKELLEALKNMGAKDCFNGIDSNKNGDCVCTACKASRIITEAEKD